MSRVWRGFLFLLIVAVSASLTAATGYQVSYGTDQDINEWSTCKNVANAHASGKAIFVPTNTSTEWSQFYTHAPTGVTISACSCAVTPGSQTFTASGTFTVKCYNTLTVQVWGGGAGGSGSYNCSYPNGVAGGNSSWNGAVFGYGGGAPSGITRGTGGSGAGGTVTAGGNGVNGAAGAGGAGGAGGNGGAGGAGGNGSNANGKVGTVPGGGGGGGLSACGRSTTQGTGGGGGGGYSTTSYSAGAFTVGSGVAVVVGGGGAGGNSSGADGGAGARGQVTVSWN